MEDFLSRNYPKKRGPLLLGLSGGADSKALLYALLDCGIQPHLAHIDHGWRGESKKEADLLLEEAKSLGLVFHTKKLVTVEKRNLEAICREERLTFFYELFCQYKYDALLLAHQKNDLLETVLKRILEGAHIFQLFGMTEVSWYKDMPLFRPLLGIYKEEIYKYLEDKKVSYFQDSTNEDISFLRGRMRKNILPQLQMEFGKGIEENLYQLSCRSLELSSYLEQRVQLYLDNVVVGSWGKSLSFNGLHQIEARYLVRKFLGFALPRKELEQILQWLKENAKDKEILRKEGAIRIDNKILFLLKNQKVADMVKR